MGGESITALREEYAKWDKHQFVPHDAQRVRYLLRELQAHREALRWFCLMHGEINEYCADDCAPCPFREACPDTGEMVKVLLDIGHALIGDKEDDDAK